LFCALQRRSHRWMCHFLTLLCHRLMTLLLLD
jgi:hypothetical protein